MNDFVLSLIRTWVPIAVGAVLGWLAAVGLSLDPETQTALVVAVTGLVQAVYYGLARWLEGKFPWFGVLLGARKAPRY